MASEDIVLRIKALMDTGDVSGAVKELQGVFNRLKLTDNIKGDFDKVFKDLAKSAEAFENKAKGSFESAADVNALKKSRKEFDNLLNGMLKSLKNLSTQDMEDIFQFDLSGIKNLTQQIEQLQKKAKETAAAAIDIQKVEKTLKGLKDMTSKTRGFDLLEDLKSGDIDSAITKFEKLQETLKGFAKGSDTAQGAVNEFLSALKAGDIEKINSSLEELTSKIGEIGKGKNGNLLFFADGLKDIAIEIQKATEEAKEFREQIKALETEKIENIGNQSREGAAGIERMGNAVQEAKGSFKQLGDNAENAAQDTRNLNKEIGELGQRASYFLSLENSVDLFRQGVRKAIDTVKELDKAMTETAVVTDFSIGDMWDKLPQYTQMANELGVATKGVYEASTLYYQQGLETEQVMALTNETLKMARIAGLDCADATDLMTAALRGFNMEINETSAQRVNDVYSELAAITAADTNEIATAMTKTASIANNANMELETTAALLAQMIETTREPAETAGTAMKTIVARFTEMKKAVGDVVTVEGEEVNVNKVEEALRSAGVALRNVNGEFRDTDDVFLELSSKWNSLDIMTQRYIATTAAGSRQQSRFIAMMQDYDRTMQLVEAAYSSAGSSSQQFEKTQESLESKLARLKNAWDTFLMGIADDQIVKGFVDILTEILEAFNKITEGADGLGGSILRLGTVFAGLRTAKGIVDKLIVSFVKLKNGEEAVGILQGLTQKITNFKMGNGFVLDVDLNTRDAQGKLVKLKNDLTGLGKAAGSSTGSWATGFRAMATSLGPVLKPLLAIAAVVGLIATTCAVIYNTSPLKAAKNDADMARSAVEDYNRALEETNEEAEALNNLMNELSSRETTFDNLIVGSLEWYEAIAKSNEELLKQIELLNSLGYNINYSYDENGMVSVDNTEQLRQAQKEVSERQIELQKSKTVASYSSQVADMREKFAQENADQAWNDYTKGYLDRSINLAALGMMGSFPMLGPYASLAIPAAFAAEGVSSLIGGLQKASQASGTLTDEQKVKLEEQAKASLAGSWGTYAENGKQKKAGQKVISNMDNVYDTFYSDEALNKKYSGNYVVDNDANPELKIIDRTATTGKRDFKPEDLTDEFITGLGYSGWEEVAQSLGMQYDSDKEGWQGLYKLNSKNEKEYFDVSSHGSVDTAENWANLMADPSGGAHIGNSKDIDAGFLAHKLATNKSSQAAVQTLANGLTESLEQEILYGTDNWDTKFQENAGFYNIEGIEKPIEVTEFDAAVNKSINQANARKQAIYDNLIGKDDQDTKDFQEGIRDAEGNAFFDTGENKSFTEEAMKNLASNIQALETDTNFVTGQAYQAFVTSKMAKRKEEGESFDAEALEEIENQYYDIFKDLDLTDATASLDTLNQKIANGVEGAEELKKNLTAEGGSLDISNQFSDLVKSGVLEEISEDIAKLSDEAGNIDVSATRELVDSNKELKNIMDAFNVSGYAMGKILTDIQNGELTLTEITSGLVEEYKLLYSAMGQAEDVLYDLRNADLGEDYTEIGRTYEERYNTAKDLYKRKAYGSENFAGNIKSLIGDEAWQSLLNESDGSNKKAYEKAIKQYKLDKNDGNLYGSFSALINEGATDTEGRQIFSNKDGKITYDFSGFETYDEILDHMVDAFSISREYAKAMLADMATYSDTLQNDLNNLNAAAAAEKNYQSMYFEQAVNKQGEPLVDKDGKPVMNAYTSQTDAEIVAVYGQTKEWEAAQETAKKEYEDANRDKKWDDLTAEERQEQTTSKFKDTYNIKNTVKDENGEDRQITKVDSYGNKYYKDKSGKTQVEDKDRQDVRKKANYSRHHELDRIDSSGVKYEYNKEEEKWKTQSDQKEVNDSQKVAELNADVVQGAMSRNTNATDYTKLAEQAKISAKDALQGIQEIAKDPVVIQMATELNSEEYDAWLEANYGENAPEIMISAGVDQSSISAVAAAKDEMITQIQGVAQALETLSITIPIEMAGGDVPIHFFGEEIGSYGTGSFKTTVTIGGEGTTSNFESTPPTTSGSTSKDPVEVPFTPKEEGSGEAYEGGSDEENGGNGGSKEEYDPVNPYEYNAKQGLEGLEYDRYINSREEELIGKLPEEVQGPLKLANLGEKMLYEAQEIGYNQQLASIYEHDMNQFYEQAEYGQYYGYNEDTMSYQYSDQFMAEYENMSLEKRQAIDEEIAAANELAAKHREVAQELEGGKIQKAFRDVSKASSDFGKELKKTEKATDAFEKTIDGLDIDDRLKDPLKKLGSRFTDVIDETEVLEKKFDGLGIVSEDTIDKLGELGLNEDLQNFVTSTLGGGKGNSVGGALGSLMGGMGDMGGMLSGMMNFDMMSMGLDGLNMGMDMFGQMKDMASQMIQYVVQFVTTVINWWINREDWLYNLLSAIEQEVHNFNRQEQVEERFRLYSDEGLDDLVSAWEAMRQSLEKQIDLNEQLIKSRQAELQFLNLTNLPFSPAFYYDYTEERVIENPWVYDIYVLLLDLGAMIPEIGQIFSSIKQLMEDNKKRMEDGVKEIEDAREEILELEKKQLELRTKYMEDEIELEELVMDTIIEKQQEEIDELSAMNDAISEGNEKLINTLNSKLDLIRQQRDNEDKEEELGEKERRLAYLRQDTSNANRKEIMDLSEELKDERRDYTDELIDQKISALEEQNELAAEQRQKQIELLQGQLDYTEKYGLQWAEAQTLIKNGFDSEGRLRVGTDLFDMLMSKEDFTSMGLGSTRQVQQIMDWNVMSIAAAAFREINDIWDEGFGNFEMSNDVHDQSRLHLWADREVDYRQLPSWLSFLQPAYNTIQDYLWRTGNNVETFVETGFLSGKNSSSILGKTIVPLIQSIAGNIATLTQGESLTLADGAVTSVEGAITSTYDKASYDWGERAINGIGNVIADAGDAMVKGIRDLSESNSLSTQSTTQSVGEVTINNYINSEDIERGESIGENIFNAFREGISNLSIFK